MDRKAYLSLIFDLLPVGYAWVRDMKSMTSRILDVAAAEFARIHSRAENLINEADPRTASELLTDWERVCGLPDTCTATATTLQERRSAVHQKWTSRGGQSPKYWKDVANRLGYSVDVTEYRPFVCGLSECGLGEIEGPESTIVIGMTDDLLIRFFWRVFVHGPRVTWFECGAGECGKDPLAQITAAEDLECQIRRLKPAHTELIFAYE